MGNASKKRSDSNKYEYICECSFPRKLKTLLKARHVTQAELAEAIGAKRQAIGQWIKAETKPNILHLKKMAQYFNVSADYLLGIVGASRTNPTIKEFSKETGLDDDAILSLGVFKKKTLQPTGKALPNEKQMRGLNKALSNLEVLNLLAAIMSIEKGEQGHHFDAGYSPEEKFIRCRMSPDSYRAFLTTQLTMVLEAAALGKESPTETYLPWYLEVANMKKKLEEEGYLNGNATHNFGTGEWEEKNGKA